MTSTTTKTTSVAEPILVALGRAAQAHAAAAGEERLAASTLSAAQIEARDRAMEEPERWDGMA